MLTILGPTASGKTRLAAQFAATHHGAILSADSRQVYRKMDIGTGKDLEEYLVDGVQVPYYLVDILDAGYRYNIYQYYQDFCHAYQRVLDAGNLPILCGGSGLYLEAALKGHPLAAIPIDQMLRERMQQLSKQELQDYLLEFPEEFRKQADFSSQKRLVRAIEIASYLNAGKIIPDRTPLTFKEPSVIVGLNLPRGLRRERITHRLKYRLENGMIEEVDGLLNSGLKPDDLSYYGLEYKWVTAFIRQEVSFELMFERLNTSIHRFAKRQMTWFRKMEKDGFVIHWIDAEASLDKQLIEVEQLWNNRG